MLRIIGICLIVAGVVVAIYGDKTVRVRHGKIGKIFAWPAGRARRLKLIIGVALIYAGLMFVTR